MYGKYVLQGAEAVKSSSQVERELVRHLHLSELHNQLAAHQLQQAGQRSAADRAALLAQNSTLLRELQVWLREFV
jgi:hypothetical protein